MYLLDFDPTPQIWIYTHDTKKRIRKFDLPSCQSLQTLPSLLENNKYQLSDDSNKSLDQLSAIPPF